MATTMFVAIPKTAIRVRKPMIRPIAPKNSAQIARKANGAGMCMVPVKNPIVPANPKPPNHPSIFCAPCAKKTTPKTSLKIVVAMLSSVEMIVRIIFFLPECRASQPLCQVTRQLVGTLCSDKAQTVAADSPQPGGQADSEPASPCGLLLLLQVLLL